jgi:hypothetical protein
MAKPPASWAARMSVSDYGELLRELRAALARQKATCRITDEGMVVTEADGAEETYGLDNLSREFTSARRASRRKVVQSYVDTLVGSRRRVEACLAQMNDLDQVRSRVKLRLHPPSHIRQPGIDHIVHWAPIEGLIATLVCDFDSFNLSVPDVTLAAWSISRDEAIALALENIAAQDPVEVTSPPAGMPAPPFFVVQGKGPYTASHALMLDRLLDATRPLGFIIAIPTRNAFLYHPIRDAGVQEAMRVLFMMADRFYDDGAGAVSKDLFWWHRGKLSRIPVTRVGERIVIDGTGEFGDVVYRGIVRQQVN